MMTDFLLCVFIYIYFFFFHSFRFLSFTHHKNIHTHKAPDDHVIQLDFRNNFNIELSPNCEYDFLEVCEQQRRRRRGRSRQWRRHMGTARLHCATRCDRQSFANCVFVFQRFMFFFSSLLIILLRLLHSRLFRLRLPFIHCVPFRSICGGHR